MSAESELYAALSAHAPLSALVSTRIYPNALPEGCAYPAVTYTRTATEPVVTIDGISHGAFCTFDVSGWGDSPDEAIAVGEAIAGALQAAGEAPNGRQSGYDEALGLDGVVVSVTLFV